MSLFPNDTTFVVQFTKQDGVRTQRVARWREFDPASEGGLCSVQKRTDGGSLVTFWDMNAGKIDPRTGKAEGGYRRAVHEPGGDPIVYSNVRLPGEPATVQSVPRTITATRRSRRIVRPPVRYTPS